MCGERSLLIVLLAGCNTVFGIDEGHLRNDAQGGASTENTGGSSHGGGDGAGGPSTTSSSGGACNTMSALTNDTFIYFEDAPDVRPRDWNRFASDATITFGPGIGSVGVGMAVIASGPNASAGLTQSVSANFADCVSIRGETYRFGGQGKLTATASFMGSVDSSVLELELPGDDEFNTFATACRLSHAATSLSMRLENRDIPEGTSFSSTVRWIKLESTCCAGSEPLCSSP